MGQRISSVLFISFIMIFGAMWLSIGKAQAAYFPLGSPDIQIVLQKTDVEPIYINNENDFNSLLDDIGKLPKLVNETMMPQAKEIFLKNEDRLVNEYIESMSASYNMDTEVFRLEVITGDDDFPDQYVNRSSDVQMSILGTVWLGMPVAFNSTTESYHRQTMSALEEVNLARVQVLTDYALETLKSHKDELLHSGNNDAPITSIYLKILDNYIARMTVFSLPDENGSLIKLFDEIKTDVHVMPEFSISLTPVLIVAGLAAMIVTMKFRRIFSTDSI